MSIPEIGHQQDLTDVSCIISGCEASHLRAVGETLPKPNISRFSLQNSALFRNNTDQRISRYDMPRLGVTIAEARKAKFLSQKELAARINKEDGGPISPQYVNDIERGRRSPSEFVIKKLAAELSLDSDHLCLLAGTVPADLAETLSKAPPKTVTRAFRRFRKEIDSR